MAVAVAWRALARTHPGFVVGGVVLSFCFFFVFGTCVVASAFASSLKRAPTELSSSSVSSSRQRKPPSKIRAIIDGGTPRDSGRINNNPFFSSSSSFGFRFFFVGCSSRDAIAIITPRVLFFFVGVCSPSGRHSFAPN